MTATTLAIALNGIVIDNHGDPRVITADGFIYVGATGKARLQRPGKPIVTLGSWSDEDELIAAYRAAVAS